MAARLGIDLEQERGLQLPYFISALDCNTKLYVQMKEPKTVAEAMRKAESISDSMMQAWYGLRPNMGAGLHYGGRGMGGSSGGGGGSGMGGQLERDRGLGREERRPMQQQGGNRGPRPFPFTPRPQEAAQRSAQDARIDNRVPRYELVGPRQGAERPTTRASAMPRRCGCHRRTRPNGGLGCANGRLNTEDGADGHCQVPAGGGRPKRRTGTHLPEPIRHYGGGRRRTCALPSYLADEEGDSPLLPAEPKDFERDMQTCLIEMQQYELNAEQVGRLAGMLAQLQEERSPTEDGTVSRQQQHSDQPWEVYGHDWADPYLDYTGRVPRP